MNRGQEHHLIMAAMLLFFSILISSIAHGSGYIDDLNTNTLTAKYQSVPSSPASGYLRCYSKSSDKLYCKNSSATEKALTYSGDIIDADIASGAAIAVNKLAAQTASRACVFDGSGFVSPATTTSTEIGYINGVTSAIQTQLNSKQASVTIGNLDSQTVNSKGLDLTSNVLSLQSADGTHPGAVNTTTQTFAGQKTFSTGVTATVTGNVTGNLTGNVTGTASGNTTYSANQYGVVLSGSANAMSVLAPNASAAFPLVSGGASANPSWSLLTVPGGGTGLATITNHGVMLGQGASAVAATATGSAGQALLSGGSSADPSYSTPTYPSASGSAGKILRADGTNNVYSTATFPNTATTSDLLYASATNVWSSLAKTNSAALLSDSSGVPTWTAYATAFNTLSPMSAVGDLIYGGTSGAGTRLAPNTSATINVLSETGTGSAGQAPSWGTVSALLDSAFSNTQGSILYRGSSTWTTLSPGTSGNFLKTQGAAANPTWAAATGTATASGAKAITNTTTTLTGNTWTDLALSTEVYDIGSIMSSSQVTCPSTGYYHADAGAVLQGSLTATDQMGIRILDDGVVQCESEYSSNGSATTRLSLVAGCDMSCTSTKVIKVQVRVQGVSGQTVVSDTYGNYFNVHYVGQ